MATYQDSSRISEARNQVNEVLDVMKNNVNKVMEREGKLSDLDTRAANLESSSIQFSASSKRLRKKYWWENLKMKLVLGGVVLAILIIIIVVIVEETKSSDDSSPTTTSSPNS